MSGFSSGAAFATQFHVVHSSTLSGVGVFAGCKILDHHKVHHTIENIVSHSGPYYCAQGIAGFALTCMSTPAMTNINTLISKVWSNAALNLVDHPAGISDDKVFLFNGLVDNVVLPG